MIEPLHGLTAKQCEVLDLLIQHKTSKEISRMLGISPHTVDQRIMLARGKLQVATRSEVAQAYRQLLSATGEKPRADIYQRSIYGPSDIAQPAETRQEVWREAAEAAFPGARPTRSEATVSAPAQLADFGAGTTNPGYYHVLPEAFDGRSGTLLRLGVIVMTTAFLTLVILGSLAIYTQLSHMVDG